MPQEYPYEKIQSLKFKVYDWFMLGLVFIFPNEKFPQFAVDLDQ